jgi:N-methylhydantoinase A
VTDADLVLGFLRDDSFSAGGPTLDRDAATESIRREIGEPLGLTDPVVAAWAIHDLVNENMAQAARLHCIEHGVDPAGIWLVATGGAGPLHASGLLAKLGCLGVVYPQSAGVASAIGLVLAPWSVERTVTEIHLLGSLSLEEIESRLDAIERSLPESAFPAHDITVLRQLHMRIRGQAYEVKVEMPAPLSHDALAQAFRSSYVERFGLQPASDAIEIVTWGVRRVEQSHRVIRRDAAAVQRSGTTRRAFLGVGEGWQSVGVTGYSAFRPGEVAPGPLLVEDSTTTIVIRSDQEVFLDEFGNLRVVRQPERS